MDEKKGVIVRIRFGDAEVLKKQIAEEKAAAEKAQKPNVKS